MPAVITFLVAVFNLIFLADLLRTKLALTIPRASSTTADEIMDRGDKDQCQGQGLSEAVSAASTTTEATILSGDVSDDEDLTQSGSGVYLQEVKTEIPRHTQLLHTLKGEQRSIPECIMNMHKTNHIFVTLSILQSQFIQDPNTHTKVHTKFFLVHQFRKVLRKPKIRNTV